MVCTEREGAVFLTQSRGRRKKEGWKHREERKKTKGKEKNKKKKVE